MKNILIVDDEYPAVYRIRNLVDYRNLDFQIIGEASNGQEAIEFLSKHPTDIIFTDVEMPKMNGIELATHVKKQFPHIKVVIMSNYSDFDYVKNAFTANVVDYILKCDLTSDSLSKLLLKLNNDTDNSLSSASVSEIMNRESIYRSQIIDAISGKKSIESSANGVVLLMRIDSPRVQAPFFSQDELDLFYRNICDLTAQVLKDILGYVIFVKNNIIVIYLPFASSVAEPSVMNKINLLVQNTSSAIHKFFNYNVLWGISRMSSRDYSLEKCYREALSMLNTSPFSAKIHPYHSINKFKLTQKDEHTLYDLVMHLNILEVNSFIDSLFTKIETDESNEVLINDLQLIASSFCKSFHIEFPNVASTLQKQSYISSADWCKKMFELVITNCIAEKNLEMYSRHTQSAILYIEQNYSTDISRTMLAEYVGVSEQHLSSIFKKDVGENLTTYINNFRIDKIKDLMKTTQTSIKNLYKSVGFYSYNHFFVVFKKHVGCTPEQYQSQFLNKTNQN